MNLAKLFETQKALNDRINYQGEDRFEKLVLALLVEIGECANEWRGFKFWSTDQKARTFLRESCPDCKEKGYYRGNPPVDEKKGVHGLGNHYYYCEKCAGFLVITRNPLLEEYVDKLHFILDIGLHLGYTNAEEWGPIKEKTITDQFIECHGRTYEIYFQMRVNGEVPISNYEYLLAYFLGLGEMLGFTPDQIESAYYAKNKINHDRQDRGY